MLFCKCSNKYDGTYISIPIGSVEMSTKRTIFTSVMFSTIIFVIMISGYLPMAANADAGVSATSYLSLVTDGLGFYKVRNLETAPRPFIYNDRILNINAGDTIIWENDADTSTLTIVSDQNLWNDQVGRMRVGQKVNYKFDKPGTYTFHLKEVSSKLQTIVVSNTGDVSTVVQTPIATTVTYPISTPATTYTTQGRTAIPTPATTAVRGVTPMSSVPKYTPIPVPTQTVPDIRIPIEVTPTSFASMAVAVLSIYVTFRRKTGK
jgi:plastocyanin